MRLYQDVPCKGPAICGAWNAVSPHTRLETDGLCIRELNGAFEIVLTVRYKEASYYVLVHEILDTQLADLCSWWKQLHKTEPQAHEGVLEKIIAHVRREYMRGSLHAVS